MPAMSIVHIAGFLSGELSAAKVHLQKKAQFGFCNFAQMRPFGCAHDSCEAPGQSKGGLWLFLNRYFPLILLQNRPANAVALRHARLRGACDIAADLAF